MGYNGPNPNKQVGGALRWPLVAQLICHNEGDILVIVSTGSDICGGNVEIKCQPDDVLHGEEVCPFDNMVDKYVQSKPEWR